ncbi:MAG: 1-acyl-sn-glycerol-3-phosphate acyltransferase [Saprospiraceae bacterium]
MKEASIEREHLYPDLRDWPIHKFHEDRKNVVRELDNASFERIVEDNGELVDLLQTVIYSEKTRTKNEQWKVDPPNELTWWRRKERKLVRAGLDENNAEEAEHRRDLLRKIIHRYSEEVVGSFKISTFQFARRFLTLAFNRLLNAAAGKNLRRIARAKVKLRDRLIIGGQVERVRKLFPDHHIVICPTHFSNLDSALIGYALDGFAGIPHSTYGAGLNLMNAKWVAYFFNRLGVYRVDRRKKNPVYLEVLKSFSRLAIYRGVNSIFYPGGTRNRSGSIEKSVKLGLLGTTIEAQRLMLEDGSKKKVIIVPLVLSYHFVLEAKFLIQDHLKRTGKEQYLGAPSRQFSYTRFLKFLWQLFGSTSEIHISLGQPLDVLGNHVNDEGQSLSSSGDVLDLKDYFVRDGVIKADRQREREYTKLLGEAVVDRFHRDHVVLTSHVVSYVAFRILTQFHPDLDLYGVLRLVEDDFLFDLDLMKKTIAQVQEKLVDMESKGLVRLSNAVLQEPAVVLEDGMANMQLYHDKKPLSMAGGRLKSQDFHLLYYYHNRLSGYPLKRASEIKFSGGVRSVRTVRMAMLDVPEGEVQGVG